MIKDKPRVDFREKEITNKDIYGTDNTAVQLMEQQYPETTGEFKRLQKQERNKKTREVKCNQNKLRSNSLIL